MNTGRCVSHPSTTSTILNVIWNPIPPPPRLPTEVAADRPLHPDRFIVVAGCCQSAWLWLTVEHLPQNGVFECP